MQKNNSSPSKKEELKAKITSTHKDLSAYFITNLIKALDSPVQIKFSPPSDSNDITSSKYYFFLKIPPNNSITHTHPHIFVIEFTNLKLNVNEGQHTLFGELAIADFLIGEKNKSLASNHQPLLTRLG